MLFWVWKEVAALALAARSQREFRGEVLSTLIRRVGGDGGFIQNLAPKHAPPNDGVFCEQDPELIQRCHTGWSDYFAEDRELRSLLRAAAIAPVVDTHVLPARDRARSVFYADVFLPQRAREAVCGVVGLGGGEWAGLCLIRRSDRAPCFDARSLATLHATMPAIVIGDALLAKRATARKAEIPVAKLTRREREVVELVVLGYTNLEIALALGTSPFTVRNQLANVFRKAGATNRAELVGIVAARD
jgi:DNA-binding CsgD family transcriptional regulator